MPTLTATATFTLGAGSPASETLDIPILPAATGTRRKQSVMSAAIPAVRAPLSTCGVTPSASPCMIEAPGAASSTSHTSDFPDSPIDRCG